MLILSKCEAQQKSMCKLLRKRVRAYYSNDNNCKAFEAWYLKKYGEPYEWKRVSIA